MENRLVFCSDFNVKYILISMCITHQAKSNRHTIFNLVILFIHFAFDSITYDAVFTDLN